MDICGSGFRGCRCRRLLFVALSLSSAHLAAFFPPFYFHLLFYTSLGRALLAQSFSSIHSLPISLRLKLEYLVHPLSFRPPITIRCSSLPLSLSFRLSLPARVCLFGLSSISLEYPTDLDMVCVYCSSRLRPQLHWKRSLPGCYSP